MTTPAQARLALAGAYDKALARPEDWARYGPDEKLVLQASQLVMDTNDDFARAVLEVSQHCGEVEVMAKKKNTAEPKWLNDAQKQALTAAGIDWKTVLLKLGQQALLILLQLLGVPLPAPSPAAKAATPGCPEHHACCCDCLASAVETVQVCADHCCDCCDLYC